MIQLQRILLATDFSENSRVAEEYACELARRFGAELHLLSVVQEPVLTAPELGTLPLVNIEELRQSAEQGLARLPHSSLPPSIRVVRATQLGSPFVEIVRYAREQAIDLIVLGTHGRTGLLHVFMGSVAENVVRKAGCPVLTVRPAGRQFVMP